MCDRRLLSPMASKMLALMLMGLIGMAVEALVPLKHMTNHCQRNIYVNDSLILDLTENLQPDRVLVGHLSCAVTLHAPAGAHLYVHVLQLAISDHIQMPDRLHIYDVSSSGKITKRLTPSTGLYGVLERPYLMFNAAGVVVPDFRSTGPRMRLDYQGKPTIIYRGFRVLITVFYSPDEKGGCRQGTLHCPFADTCVPFSVRCDKYPNCGLNDNQDEKSCQREMVVSDLVEKYATRTAIIAGVSGICVFLGTAALVYVIILKYNRKKYGRTTDHAARYTSRGGGASEQKNEADLARLYAPPSYEDVMNPRDQELALLGRYGGHRHCDPPPAYSTVAAALIHQEEMGGGSSEDDASGHKRPSSLWSARPPSSSHHPSQRQRPRRPRDRATEEEQEDEEDVRMHGTWPSDTDEEEEVRARRRKKGGKCKGKARATSSRLGDSAPAADSSSTATAGSAQGESSGGKPHEDARAARPGKADFKGGRAPPFSPVSSADCSSEGSPSHHQVCSSAGTDVPSDVPSDASGSGGGAGGSGSGGEVMSETESQLAVCGDSSSNKRNSRTESDSPDSSSASSHPDSPAKKPLQGSEKDPEKVRDLHPDTSSSIHPLSPSVIPQHGGKLSPDPTSTDAALKGLDQKNVDPEDQCFVDLNPSRNSYTRNYIVQN